MQAKQVAIIGAGLTGLSLAYYLTKQGISCTILEKSNRCGGVIKTITKGEFTFESGPNTGVLGLIEIEQLIAELHNSCTLETANDSAKKRLIWKNNVWHALPSGLLSAITTPLFSNYDKFRILGEPFRKKGTNPNETIRNLVERRLGKSFHDYAVAPFINGVYAGNTDELIPRFALAKLYALEQKYGSFVGGTIQKGKYNKKHNIPLPSKKVFSMQGGLESLIQALQKQVSQCIKLQCNEITITPTENQFQIKWIQNNTVQEKIFSHVVTTCNAPELQNILPWLPEKDKQVFSHVQYAPIIQASIGFKTWKGIDIQAFGGLIPPKEKREILGVLFPSSMFSNRAPKEGALLSVFMGGTLRKDLIKKTDAEIIEILKHEITDLLQIPEWNPNILELFRYERAITQYTIHMEQVFDTIQTIETTYPNLYIAGSIRNGIGMADRIKQASDLNLTISNNEI